MRIVFMGTPQFSATILKSLAQHHDIAAAFTRPDAVRGRGKGLVASPVKAAAEELDIPVFTPKSLRDEQTQQQLASFDAEAFCVAAYGAILPKAVLEMPQYGCFNVHGSLLPRWRGAAPIERAILAGDSEAGVCIMRMEEGLDTGDYCVSVATPVEGKSVETLTCELADLGADALLEALQAVEEQSIQWTVQDESSVTYAEKIEKRELDLSVDDGVVAIDRKVRASSASHPSKVLVAGKAVTVLSGRISGEGDPEQAVSLRAGSVAFAAKRLFLGAEDGVYEIIEVKPDGKQAMQAKAFAAGIQGIKTGQVKWEGIGAR